MVKASALYIVIIIALVIGLLCSAIIVSAYFYKMEYQKKIRYTQLQNNLNSGINILLASSDTSFTSQKKISLFGGDADSVSLQKLQWGIYECGVVKAFNQKDTLYRTFSFASRIDSAKWAVLYLIDQDRPFSLSGKTTIRGDAYIPKAGVQSAYIDGKAYEGDKRFIIGKKHDSQRSLPVLDGNGLKQFEAHFTNAAGGDTVLTAKDSLRNSFLRPTHVFNFKKKAKTISDLHIDGNIILFSDTTITIDSTVVLKNVQVYARAIVVKSGFHGICQLFATDSIRVEARCAFGYPSSLGVFRFRSSAVNSQIKINVGQNTTLWGAIFSYDNTGSQMVPIITLQKNSKITGQVYSQGIVELQDKTEIDGSAFTSKFIYRNTTTLFENYLINCTIDSRALSPYYLTSGLFPVSGKRKKVLHWLEAN